MSFSAVLPGGRHCFHTHKIAENKSPTIVTLPLKSEVNCTQVTKTMHINDGIENIHIHVGIKYACTTSTAFTLALLLLDIFSTSANLPSSTLFSCTLFLTRPHFLHRLFEVRFWFSSFGMILVQLTFIAEISSF